MVRLTALEQHEVDWKGAVDFAGSFRTTENQPAWSGWATTKQSEYVYACNLTHRKGQWTVDSGGTTVGGWADPVLTVPAVNELPR